MNGRKHGITRLVITLLLHNFFAIRLYEDLQDNPNLIIRYANDDPHQLEGLQQTTKKTIKKWLEYNSN